MFVLHCFLLIGHTILTAAVQVARVSPSPVGDASHRFRHDSYVDKKVRQVAFNMLNHQNYHQRNVMFPSSASIFPTFVSNLTIATPLLSDAGIQLQPTTTIPPFKALQSLENATVSGSQSASVASSPMLQQTLSSPISNLSVVVPSVDRGSSPLQAHQSSFPSLSIICHAATGVDNSSTSLTSAARRSSLGTGTGVLSVSSMPSASVSFSHPSSVPPNVPSGGSTGRTYTASRYNSSVATGIGHLIPPPVASSYLTRYAATDRLHLTTNLRLATNVGVSWEVDTENVCLSHLGELNGIATNPSGVSPCYNVRNLDNYTGAFNAELRLYRIAAATGDWTELRSDGVAVGMSYPDATVSLQNMVKKRGLVEFRPLFIRADDAAPKLLQTLSFLGQVNNGSIPELYVDAIALALLTPKINFAGLVRHGTPISTQLSLQDASFVNGLFADPAPNTIGSSSLVVGSRDWLSKANSFSGFPISLFLVALWSVILFAMEGYELLEKLKCRYEDRRRMLAGSSGGLVEI